MNNKVVDGQRLIVVYIAKQTYIVKPLSNGAHTKLYAKWVKHFGLGW